MDGRQPNPFRARDTEQPPWSFDRLNEALPAQYFPVPHHRTAPESPIRISTAPRQRSPQRPFTRPSSERYDWHNPLSRNEENALPHSSHGNAAQEDASHTPVYPAATPGPSQQPIYALGTREEVQSEDYVSPLATMYGRAWNRYREAEENRAANRREALANARANIRYPGNPMTNVHDLLGSGPPQYPDRALRLAEEMESRRFAERIDRRERRLSMLQQAQERIQQATEAVANPLRTPRANPIDMQQSRPPPLSSDEMVANIECRICHEQKMDTLLEPCMHLAICHWCAEVMRQRTRQYRVDAEDGDEQLKCPICRRRVTQSRRIFVVL
ncbi:hypothetical protein H2200_004704 [Cladophialophora chaetospira]|uniref:RING-type domain-containing protein n=1 Tax=Cladophialophora chaetospira TaxID=386627 RepID=A0AA38XDR3_9EURO|nr:hypothetical protein H2200_004704 [Cladophialophora chaetospira]